MDCMRYHCGEVQLFKGFKEGKNETVIRDNVLCNSIYGTPRDMVEIVRFNPFTEKKSGFRTFGTLIYLLYSGTKKWTQAKVSSDSSG